MLGELPKLSREVHYRQAELEECVYLAECTYQQATAAVVDGRLHQAAQLRELLIQWRELVQKGGGPVLAICPPPKDQATGRLINLRPVSSLQLARLDGRPFLCGPGCYCRTYPRHHAGAARLALVLSAKGA